MKLYDVLQVAIVGGALGFSALYALGRVAPGLRKRCGSWLARPEQPRVLRYVGAKLAGGGGGCGDGCDTCGSCGPTAKSANARKISVNQL
jgi:hypothetical protein